MAVPPHSSARSVAFGPFRQQETSAIAQRQFVIPTHGSNSVRRLPLKAIEEFHRPLSDGSISEDSINTLGYRLWYGQNKHPEAIKIFQLNVQLHPDSWSVYDSLGEAYSNAGQRDLAIKNYKKSLELNPKNDGAVKMLAKLQAK